MKKNFSYPTTRPTAIVNVPVLCTRCGDEYLSDELEYGCRDGDTKWQFFCRNDNCYGRVDSGVYKKSQDDEVQLNVYIPFINEAAIF